MHITCRRGVSAPILLVSICLGEFADFVSNQYLLYILTLEISLGRDLKVQKGIKKEHQQYNVKALKNKQTYIYS